MNSSTIQRIRGCRNFYQRFYNTEWKKGNMSCKCFLPLCGKKDITWYVSFFISNYTLQQLSRSIRWWGTMILVAGRFGFSMWLMIWEAASLPS